MKKSLIALAVLGTAGLGFSGAAMAQSSVTMYGVADAGISRTQEGPKVEGEKREYRTGMSSSGTMNNGTSRLGVRGVEDLGGGLKAGFNFESGLSLNDGSTGYSGGQFWSRAANVWLGGNWGTFQMGRALNPSFYAVAAWELTGTANYSVVGNTYNYTAEGPRTSSMFLYKTPNFSGLSASIAAVAKDDNRATPADRDSGRAHYDLNVVYDNGPIAAGLGVNKTRSDDSTPRSGKTNYTIGGKYSFGQFAVAASYNATNNWASPTGAVYGKRNGVSLGGSFLTGPFTATLDLTRDTKAEDLLTGNKLKKRTNGVLEGKYALSKRTFVYAAYLRWDNTNNYGIGLRHNF